MERREPTRRYEVNAPIEPDDESDLTTMSYSQRILMVKAMAIAKKVDEDLEPRFQELKEQLRLNNRILLVLIVLSCVFMTLLFVVLIPVLVIEYNARSK